MAGISGPHPVFRKKKTLEEEGRFLARCILQWQEKGVELNTVAIVYPHNNVGHFFQKFLEDEGIPSVCLASKEDKRAYNPEANQVVLLSRHSSKGLEFDTVLLCGIGELKDNDEKKAQEARLLYVGMTRARKQLLITSSKKNWFTDKLEELSAPVNQKHGAQVSESV